MSSERTLKGSRLGTPSYEDDRDVSPAPRHDVAYDCVSGHHFELTLAVDAEVPEVWECPRCGGEAIRYQGDRPEPKRVKPPRTHWDMLMERRTMDELEQLLAERLAMLRSGQIGPEHLHSGDAVAEAGGTATKTRKRAAKSKNAGPKSKES